MGFLTTLIATSLLATFLATGVAIAFGGVIGRPIAITPCCSRCRHGVALSLQSLRAPCPECGGNLAAADGIRYFRTVRQPWRIGLGIAVALLAFAVPVAFQALLMRSSPSVSAATSSPDLAALIAKRDAIDFFALSEAHRRLVAGALADADLATLARAVITARASDRSGFVQASEVQIVVAADGRKLLGEDELLAFFRSLAEPPTLSLPQRIRVPHDLVFPSWPPSQNDAVRRDLDLVGLRLDETDLTILDNSNNQPISRVAFGVFARVTVAGPPGEHHIHATFEESYGVASNPTPRMKTTRAIDLPIEIVADGAPTWIGTESPAARRADVDAACNAIAVALDADASGTQCSIRVNYRLFPVASLSFGFDILVLLDGVEYPVARHVIGWAGGTLTEWPATLGERTMPMPTGSIPREATVIFRPNPGLLETVAGVERIWGEEVRREHVPVVTTLGRAPSASPAGGSP